MAKYYRFHYSAGYVGTDVDEIFKFPDNVTENEVSETFDEWYDEQLTSSGSYEEISEEKAEKDGIDEDLSESEE
jgi:hypothetical protein